MAFFRDEEEENQQGLGQGGVQTSGQTGVIGAGGSQGAGASPQAAKAAPDKASNFVGIKQYLDANKNQAAKLGDQTAGVINQSADQARHDVGALNQAADSAIKPVNQVGDDVYGKLNTAAETLSQDERKTLKDTASATYKGPRDATGLGDAYANAAKASNAATQNVQNSGTEEGRMNLIGQVNSKPRTQGMNVFDNALLQAGGGREKLSQASQANQDILGGMDAATQGINAKIGRADDPSTPDVDESSGAIGQTNKSQADAYQKIQNALGSWKSGFTPKVAQAQQDLINRQQGVATDIAESPLELDTDTMNLLGLSSGANIYGLNLSDYINQANPAGINAGNVASAEDYARYGALADLAGEQDLLLNPENVGQAGTLPQLTANQDKLRDDMRNARNAYEEAYASEFLEGGGTNHTIQDWEQNILPAWIQNYGGDSRAVKDVEAALNTWKNNRNANNIVNPRKGGKGY